MTTRTSTPNRATLATMVRLVAIIAMAFIATACSSADEVAVADSFELDALGADEPIMVYRLPSGECAPACAARLEVFRDGLVEVDYRGGAIDWNYTLDPTTLIAAIESSTPSDLIVGSDDCERDLDGNAWILEVAQVELDQCFSVLDEAHPIVKMANEIETNVSELFLVPAYVHSEDLPDPQRHTAIASLVEETPWPDQIDPSDCETRYSTVFSNDETRYLAVEADGDLCWIWFNTYDENKLCRIPQSWPSGILLSEGSFGCPGALTLVR